MTPGHGDVLIAEGDIDVAADEERLVEEFRRQLELGMWAVVPTRSATAAARRRWSATSTRSRGRRARHLLPQSSRRMRLGLPRTRRQPARPVGNPARELHAEERALELLRSVVGPDDFAMYRDLGFLLAARRGDYGYLIYPQRPIVAYDAKSGERAAQRVLRALRGPQRPRQRPRAARRRRRARQVDGAARRRARVDRRPRTWTAPGARLTRARSAATCGACALASPRRA